MIEIEKYYYGSLNCTSRGLSAGPHAYRVPVPPDLTKLNYAPHSLALMMYEEWVDYKIETDVVLEKQEIICTVSLVPNVYTDAKTPKVLGHIFLTFEVFSPAAIHQMAKRFIVGMLRAELVEAENTELKNSPTIGR